MIGETLGSIVNTKPEDSFQTLYGVLKSHISFRTTKQF